MKRIIILLLLLLLLLLLTVGQGWGATTFQTVGNWSNAGNWSAGKPDVGTDAIIAANCNVDEAGATKDFTVNNGVTLSGSSALDIHGSPSMSTGSIITYSGNMTITPNGTSLCYMGGKTWPGNTEFVINGSTVLLLMEENMYSRLTITFNPTTDYPILYVLANQTATNTLTINGNTSAEYYNVRGFITNYPGEPRRTITAASVSVNGSVDFRGIAGAGAASWELSSVSANPQGASGIGNAGNNSGITFRAPRTYYLTCGTLDRQDYHDVWSLSDDGIPDGAGIFPLPHDHIVINNNSWTDAGGHWFYSHSGSSRLGSVDASALTKPSTIGFHGVIYGNLDMTGSGAVLDVGAATVFDSTLKHDTSESLDINVLVASNTSGPTDLRMSDTIVGTVRLMHDLVTPGGTFLLQRGNFDLNGHTLKVDNFSATFSEGRSIIDSTGNGKIILTGTSGTLFDTTNASNLTISNSPSIQIGDGTQTYTGDVTFMGAGKIWGNLIFTPHAGNYKAIITGANTFNNVSFGTPSASYQYVKAAFTSGTTTTVGSLSGTGTKDYPVYLTSTTGGSPATLSDSSGDDKIYYASIQDITVQGGATWTDTKGTNVSGNTGWIFDKAPSGNRICIPHHNQKICWQ